MAVCFSMTKIGETEPTNLQEVDNEMASHFGVEPNPIKWYRNWYNNIGLAIACGCNLDEIAEEAPEWADIIHWIQQNYVIAGWRQ